MFPDVEHLREQIKAFGLEAIQERLVALAKPAITIDRVPVEDALLPIGASKFGGSPDLPDNMDWFYRGEKPLTFIAQFRLSELANAKFQASQEEPTNEKQLSLWDLSTIPKKPQAPDVNLLPTEGMLYFFFDIYETPWLAYENSDAWRIIYIANEQENLKRIAHPTYDGTNGIVHALRSQRLHFSRTLSLTVYLDASSYEFLYENSDKIGFPEFAYEDFIFQTGLKNGGHCYGYAEPLQNLVEEACVIGSQQLHYDANHRCYRDKNGKVANILKAAQQWEFLFQIKSDEGLGNFYVCIPKESLKERRFEDAWVIIQWT